MPGVQVRAMMRLALASGLLALVFWMSVQLAMAEPSETATEFDPVLFAAEVERLREAAGVPGLAVAVLNDGKTLHLQGYGTAGPDQEPVTTDTVFQVGSITKSFVALIILQLAAEGRLDLDEPVARYLPGFRTAVVSQSDLISVDHLVTHRSGLTTLTGNSNGVENPQSSGRAEAVAQLAAARLFAEPGTVFQYSNANYVVLSHLIEVLDQRTFEQAVAGRIFNPLEMTNSHVAVPPPGDSATGYRLWFGVPVASDTQPDRVMAGAGGITASIEDIARYVDAVRTRDPRIVPASADRLFAIKPIHEQWGYGYGWFSNTVAGNSVYEHSGFTPGFLSLATIVPATGQVVVALTNMSGLAHGQLPRAVTNVALGWPPVPAAASFFSRTAIWSLALVPFALLLFLYRTVRRLGSGRVQMTPWIRVLNGAAILASLGVAFGFYWAFQRFLGVSFATGYAFFPDMAVTVAVTIGLAVLLAAGRLVVAVRGG